MGWQKEDKPKNKSKQIPLFLNLSEEEKIIMKTS
jgi:hypothetical protein